MPLNQRLGKFIVIALAFLILFDGLGLLWFYYYEPRPSYQLKESDLDIWAVWFISMLLVCLVWNGLFFANIILFIILFLIGLFMLGCSAVIGSLIYLILALLHLIAAWYLLNSGVVKFQEQKRAIKEKRGVGP